MIVLEIVLISYLEYGQQGDIGTIADIRTEIELYRTKIATKSKRVVFLLGVPYLMVKNIPE
jgi:hypothetical protein